MKKVLFVSFVTLLSVAVLAGCGNSSRSAGDSQLKADNSSLKQQVKSLKAQIATQNASSSAKDTEVVAENTNKTTKSTAVMGKEYIIKDKAGKKLVGLTLTQADSKFSGFATEDGVIDDPDFNQGKKDNLIQLSMKYTNYGLNDEWGPSTGIEVYDSTGAQATNVSYEDGGDMVSVGHSGTLTTWYTLSQVYATNKKLEIEYSEYLTAAGSNDDEKYSAKWVVQQ
ncbi:hypothetical protein [Lacticaseibacillus sp. GG6-2]